MTSREAKTVARLPSHLQSFTAETSIGGRGRGEGLYVQINRKARVILIHMEKILALL